MAQAPRSYQKIRQGVEQPLAVFEVYIDGTSYIDEMSLDMVEEEYQILLEAFKEASNEKDKELLRKQRRPFETARSALFVAGAKLSNTASQERSVSEAEVERVAKKLKSDIDEMTSPKDPDDPDAKATGETSSDFMSASCPKDPHAPKDDGMPELTRSELIAKAHLTNPIRRL